MKEFVIEVSHIEELQTVKEQNELEKIFTRAKSTIVNGEKVLLGRKGKDGIVQIFDELTTLEDLDNYQQSVFKYL